MDNSKIYLYGKEVVTPYYLNEALADKVTDSYIKENYCTKDDLANIDIPESAKNIQDGTNTGALKSVGSTESSGLNSIALGLNNTATGNASVALGSYNEVTAPGAIALGSYNYVEGSDGVALGGDNSISGRYAIAEGLYNMADADYTHAEG